jgi:hypothetical protein
MDNEIEDKGIQDASTDLQKVAGVRSDHRFMLVDPTTRRFVYAETNQLPVGEVSDEQINNALDSKKNVPGGLVGTDKVIYRASIAEIRSFGGALISTFYYTTDFGAQGSWYYDPTDLTSQDNTGTVLVDVAGRRYKRIISDGTLILSWFLPYGNNINNDSDAFLKCFSALKPGLTTVLIPPPLVRYKVSQAIYVDSSQIGQIGFSVKGTGSAGSTFIEYFGPNYLFNFFGDGSEDGVPLTRFELSNLRINGGENNVISTGGINIKRAYIVKVENVFCTGFKKADAVSASIRNCFNIYWNGGQIANGYPKPEGLHSLVIGSENPHPWNSSNVEFKNMLIQYAGSHGVHVIQDGNIFDNLTFNNVSFGKNGGWSFYCDSPNVNNISLENNHYESCGYNPDSITDGKQNPNANTGHIYVSKSKGLKIQNNSFQDALTYIKLDSVEGFQIDGGNKFFETGYYNLNNNKMLELSASTGHCIGEFGENTIRTDQIETLFSINESVPEFRVDLSRRFRTKVIEATWNSEIFNNPRNYQGTIIDRYQSANAPFDQMYSSGVTWYRSMISSKYKGEKSFIPTTTENAGSWYANVNPSVKGSTGSAYMLFGWISAGGGVWKEMRMPLDQSPFAINTTTTELTTAQLNTTYPNSNTDNGIGKVVYAPNIVAGPKMYVKLAAAFWLTFNAQTTA